MFDHALGSYPHANAVVTPGSAPRLGYRLYLDIWYTGVRLALLECRKYLLCTRGFRGRYTVPSPRDSFEVGACAHVSVRTILSFRELRLSRATVVRH